MKDLTIIVPVFNEQESLHEFKKQMDDFLNKSPVKASILFVNDGSSDDSYNIIQAITRADNRYICISLLKNHGLSTALKAGIDYAKSSWIGYIDADLQTTPMDLLQYFKFMGSYEMVNGIRTRRKDSLVKKLSSKIANGFRKWVINDHIEDTCCPLKLIKASYAKEIPFFDGMHRFLPALVQLHGGKVKQMEVKHFKRFAGTAKYNLTNRLIGPFLDTLAFVWIRKRYINYTVMDREMVASYHKKQIAS